MPARTTTRKARTPRVILTVALSLENGEMIDKAAGIADESVNRFIGMAAVDRARRVLKREDRRSGERRTA